MVQDASQPLTSLQSADRELADLMRKERGRQLRRRNLQEMQLVPHVDLATGTAAQSLRVALEYVGDTGNKLNPWMKTGLVCLASLVVVVARRGWKILFSGDPCNHLAALCRELGFTAGSSVSLDGIWHGLKWVFQQFMASFKENEIAEALKLFGAGILAQLIFKALYIFAMERRSPSLGEMFDAFLSAVGSSLPAAGFALGPLAFALALVVAVGIWGLRQWMNSVPKDDGKAFHDRVPASMPMRTARSFWAAFTGQQAMPKEWDLSVDKEMSLDLAKEGAHLLCPISLAVIVEPVLLRGQLYERYWIEKRLINDGTDIFNERANLAELRESRQAAAIIKRWAESEGLQVRSRRI